jgi:putative alpha-1,2-mannosidase
MTNKIKTLAQFVIKLAPLILALLFAGCSNHAKPKADNVPPERVDLTPYAARHIVAMPAGSFGLRPLFKLTGDRQSTQGVENRQLGSVAVLDAASPAPMTALLTITPSLGERDLNADASSPISLESASPGYYKVRRESDGTFFELTAAEHSGLCLFRFRDGSATIFIKPQAFKGEAFIRLANPQEIEGNTSVTIGVPSSPKPCFFVIRFERSAMSGGIMKNNQLLPENTREAKGTDIGAFFGFRVLEGDEILLKIATSLTSCDDARAILNAELPGGFFSLQRENVRERWQNELQQIKVYGGDTALTQLFYASLSQAIVNAAFTHSNKDDAPLFERLKSAYFQPWLSANKLPSVDNRRVHEIIRQTLMQENSMKVGQTPAWFVFALMGIMPAGETGADYNISTPFFDRVEINPAALTTATQPLIIIAKNRSETNTSVKSVRWNDNKVASTVFKQQDLEKGGRLEIIASK